MEYPAVNMPTAVRLAPKFTFVVVALIYARAHSQAVAWPGLHKVGSEFSRSLLSTDSLTEKHLATKDDVHHPVYDYSQGFFQDFGQGG